MSDTETPQTQAPQTQSPPATRAPKLAPAPVPQDTPWKAPVIDSSATKPNFEAAEAVKPAKKQGSAEPKDAGSKRSTTGKEKWVEYAPVVPIATGASGSGKDRSRQKRQQNNNGANSFRNRRGQANGNADKRKSGNLSAQASRGAGHQRTQSKGGKSLDGSGSSNSRSSSAENASSNGAANEATSNGAKASSSDREATPDVPVTGVESLHVGETARGSDRPHKGPHHKANYAPRPNSHGKKPRYGGPRPNYYQGGAPYFGGGVPYQMMPVAVAPQDYTYSPEYMFSALATQVNHYFSIDNLCRDMFLRSNMNEEGLVPLSVIAAFRRVKLMTTDLDTVYQACQSAPNIVVVGNKVKAAKDPQNWVLEESKRTPASRETGSAEYVPAPKEPKFQVQQAVPFVPRAN